MECTSQCLLLSYDYRALRLINWQQAFKLIFTEKAEIIKEFAEGSIKTVSQSFKVPAVIRLLKKFKLRTKVRLSRKNILIRDKFKCRYCGFKGTSSVLTLDHVVPRSRGGKFTWENIVTSCWDCNNVKGNRLPEEAGMFIHGRPPHQMDVFEYIKLAFESRADVEEWQDFLP
jgi:5-methylcytosine-specific restriction endonuclease McrA